jgi:hypothetical protein
MRVNAITKDDADRLTFPGGPSNHNNALRTLRRMLGKAEEWNVIKASPKIKLMQQHAGARHWRRHRSQAFAFLQTAA